MTRRRLAFPTLAALAAMLPAAGAALAQAPEGPGDAARGGQLAQERCGSCHVIAEGHQPTTQNAPPSFLDLAKETDGNDLSVLEALEESRHPAMPGGPLQRQDLRDISAYIGELE